MATATIDLPLQIRQLSVVPNGVDTEKRTVQLSFSSNTPYARTFNDQRVYETLSHDPGAMVTGRLDKKAVPFLLEHDWSRSVGKVIDYSLSDGKAYATIKLSRSAAATEVLNDLADGIKSEVSVGYQIQEMKRVGTRADDSPEMLITKWEPFEVSLVGVPLDYTVGVGRGADNATYPAAVIEPEEATESPEVINNRSNTSSAIIMADPIATEPKIEVRSEGPDINKIRNDEHARIREINAIGSRFNAPSEANDFIRDGKSISEFQSFVLANKVNSEASVVRVLDGNLGMSPKDQSRYSLTKALLEGAGGLSGYEKECSEEVTRSMEKKPKGFYVPNFALTTRADLSVTGGAPTGGNLVATILEPTLVPYLRNLTVCGKAGATMMGGLQGNVSIPRQTGTSTANWMAETAVGSRSAPTFDQIQLTPNRLYGETAYSKLLLAQSSLDVQSLVRADLLEVVALAIDAAGLTGSGSGNVPGGITSLTPGSGYPIAASLASPSVTFPSAAYATWTEIVSFEESLELSNVNLDDSSVSWVVDPTVKALWKTVGLSDPRATAFYPVFLWSGTNPGQVNGYRAFSTNQLTGGKVIFGKFADMIIATWGSGLDIETDPYSLMSSAQIRIGVNTFVDIGFRRATSFAFSTNSGAQHP